MKRKRRIRKGPAPSESDFFGLVKEFEQQKLDVSMRVLYDEVFKYRLRRGRRGRGLSRGPASLEDGKNRSAGLLRFVRRAPVRGMHP